MSSPPLILLPSFLPSFLPSVFVFILSTSPPFILEKTLPSSRFFLPLHLSLKSIETIGGWAAQGRSHARDSPRRRDFVKYARRRDASVISMARRRLSRIRDTSRKVISSQAGRKRLEGSWDRGGRKKNTGEKKKRQREGKKKKRVVRGKKFGDLHCRSVYSTNPNRIYLLAFSRIPHIEHPFWIC